MTHAELRQRLDRSRLTPDEVFKLVRSIAYFFQHPESDKVEALDLIIRLLDKREQLEKTLRGIDQMIDALTREAGLYPYIKDARAWHDELVLEMMKAPGLPNIVFHVEQAIVFNKLAEGRSIILSAPTSFGKSLLIDALISFRKPKTVMAVVPTIALLDEFRRRISKRFPDYDVITHAAEQQAKDRVIFIGTQERLLERTDISAIDLFIIDEFYKLDLERNDERSLALNTILAKFGTKSKQIYLIGPSIDEVPNVTRFRSDIEFIKTRYSPVTADIIDRTGIGSDPNILLEDLRSAGKSQSLIYVRSPRSAWTLGYELLDKDLYETSSFCEDLGEWLGDNFHPEWILAESVAEGIGIHHGRIPRAIAHLLISLFNKGELGAILCTSSMIEGVNTAAENVFIFDKHISTSKLDRFTFDNIKGRAGRLFKHKVGKIYLYNPQPEESEFQVRIPLFEDERTLRPELLVQLDDASLSSTARQRKRAIASSSLLPIEVLARWADYGVDALNALADQLSDDLRDPDSRLFWKGVPDFEQVEATFGAVWGQLNFPKHDMRTPRQTAYFANVLRRNGSTKGFLHELVKSQGSAAQPEIDTCFNFMRGCEYTFPQLLRALNDVIDTIIGEGEIDYRVYASMLQNLFLPGEMRALDEYGIPVPVVEKILDDVNPEDLIGARNVLSSPNSAARRKLTDFENEMLNASLAE